LRIAQTHHSETHHELNTVETVSRTPITVWTTKEKTLETIALSFQSGVAADTLAFGSQLFSHYSGMSVSPVGLRTITADPDASLTDLENVWNAELGAGRRFNDKWASYQATETIKISGGIRYNNFGDANAEVGGTPVGSVSGNLPNILRKCL
jgi:long-chain fatty acid transport protein